MSSFLTNVLKLVSSNIIAQLIGILIVPILSRLYSPEDFGIYQLFLSISSIIVVFSCLSYEQAIMLPSKDEDSANIAALCILITALISVVSGIILLTFSEEIGRFLNTPQISDYLIYIPPIVFISSLVTIGGDWLTRKKRFGIIGASQVTNTVMSKIVQVGAGMNSAASLGLIFGWITGICASLVVLLSQIKEDLSLFKTITIEGVRVNAIRYKNFPIYSSWSTLANTLSTQITPFLLAKYFSPTIVGYFSVANMVVFLPMSFIGTATSQVFFQKACEEKNREGNITNLVREIQQRLISLGMFPMLLLIVIGSDVFSVVLGAQWSVAGEFAGILAPWLLFVFIASPLSSIFLVLERQAVNLTFNLLILISRFIVLTIGGLSGNPNVALLLYSITGVFFWGGMNLYLLKISGISYRIGLQVYIKYFTIAFVIVIPVVAAKLLSVPTPILLTVAGITSIIYYFYIIQHDPIMKSELYLGLTRSERWASKYI